MKSSWIILVALNPISMSSGERGRGRVDRAQGGEVATSPGTPGASRSRERRTTSSPAQPLEEAWL